MYYNFLLNADLTCSQNIQNLYDLLCLNHYFFSDMIFHVIQIFLVSLIRASCLIFLLTLLFFYIFFSYH